jgi:potassium-transporting ATPase KdpC subunit
MKGQLAVSIRITLVLTFMTGLLYPAFVTGLAGLLFPEQANGSLLRADGRIVGSSLIGQRFSQEVYFHGRPSEAGNGYDATNSGGSNLGPTSRKLVERIKADIDSFKKSNPGFSGDIPADLLTSSGSGLDPHISPAAAEAQLMRVAGARRMPESKVRELIRTCNEGRQFGFLGEARVNVLKLNLALDRACGRP